MPRIHEENADAHRLQPLIAALSTIQCEYMAFISKDVPEEAKLFAARHAAGKAAVAHVAALSKLLRWSEAVSVAPDSDNGEPLDELIAAAREAMANYDEDDDDA